jgi:hypothetical protein
MRKHKKRVEELTVADLEAFPVWQYTNSDEQRLGETAVRPIKKTPVKNLDGRLVGTQIRLANGSNVWALIGNVDSSNARSTQHFFSLSVFNKGRYFTMARYHDFDYDERGPQALAAFLGLPVEEVFPISYDITRFSVGELAALLGTIEKEPREKLTRAQLMGLAVTRTRYMGWRSGGKGSILEFRSRYGGESLVAKGFHDLQRAYRV